MKVLAYFLYGDDREYQQELEFSLLSALRFLKQRDEGISIRLICESETVCSHLPIERLIFSEPELLDWTYNKTFGLRAKIGALLKAVDHYQCPTVLIDTDTYFTEHPVKLFERVSETRSLLHTYEYPIVDSSLPGWKRILDKIGAGIEIDGVPIHPQSPMYNSGVVGVHPAHRSRLETAFAIVDHLHAIAPVFTLEQYGFSASLAHHTDIATCEDVIQHYWGAEKDFIRVQIVKSLEQGTADALLTQLPKLERIYPPIRKRDRILTGLSFFKHRDNHYRRAQLAYRSALFYAKKDIGYANAWANNALQALRISTPPFEHADFQQFRQNTIHSLPWISPSVKRGWIKFWQQMN